MKLAPTLRAVVALYDGKGPVLLGSDVRQAEAELRALLRVARAAGRLQKIGGCGRRFCQSYFDEACPALKSTRAALRALDRASGRGENEGEREP